MAEAYVLAEALRTAGGDYHSAFNRYQTCLTPFLKRKQESASKFATSFVPKTALGISFRNVVTRLLGIPLVADFFIGRDLRDDFDMAACSF
jgi:2-polyprenyl-6-methoxyphenol hydroxylase-like FAD-dependent oxidoreductase